MHITQGLKSDMYKINVVKPVPISHFKSDVIRSWIAQYVEQVSSIREVVGSNPT